MRSGDRPGLQNRRVAGNLSLMGSTPIRFRHFFSGVSVMIFINSHPLPTATAPLLPNFTEGRLTLCASAKPQVSLLCHSRDWAAGRP